MNLSILASMDTGWITELDQKVWLLAGGVIVIIVSLVQHLKIGKFEITVPASARYFGTVIGLILVGTWVWLYLQSPDEKVIPISKFKHFSVREGAVYDIKDGRTVLHLACTDVLVAEHPDGSGRHADFTISVDDLASEAESVEVKMGNGAMFKLGSHKYVIRVDDLHNVALGADIAETTLAKME